MSRNRLLAVIFLLTSALYFSTYAVLGIGIQWGNDFSLYMDNKINEPLAFNQLKVTVPGIGQPISGKDLQISVTRTDWERKMVDIGAKVYVDIIPILDAIELSANYGVWEYKGSIRYPASISYSGNSDSPVKIDSFAVVPITFENFDMGYYVKNTPYMKLNFDLTVRKYIAQIPWPLKVFNLYGGGGLSLIFATPALTSQLVEDALGNKLNTTLAESALKGSLFGNNEVMKAVAEEITAQLMTPHWGCHIDLGLMIKIPVLPVGFYVDGKFIIPFSDLDKEANITAKGLLLNTGIAFTF
jgi:hypothetical protein